MKPSPVLPLLLCSVLMLAAPNGRASEVRLKPGKWVGVLDDGSANQEKDSFCVDSRFNWARLVKLKGGSQCRVRNLQENPGSVAFDVDCPSIGGSSASGSVVVTGNFQTNYAIRINGTVNMPRAGSMKVSSKGSGKRTGPCDQ